VTSPKVLIVEGEPNVRDLVSQHLRHEGYACDSVADAHEALRRAEAQRFDLVVLDPMVPGVNGQSLCRAVRNAPVNRDVPILMLSARADESAKVVGLESGADDYLTKPFGVRELVARTKALLKRRRRPDGPTIAAADAPEPAPIRLRGLEIDPARRRVRIEGREVGLTDQEFRLLQLLATHVGIVFSREALLAKIWRGDTFVTVRSVDTLVKRVRRRIEPDPPNPRYLLTVWGVGYKFADTPET
jgi:two-component system OmpR family response regulator/two-component system alkaline phosphatase synthesis response regulator PhoP